jgi:hypothetical protein
MAKAMQLRAVLLALVLVSCGGGGGGGEADDAAPAVLDPRPPAGPDSPDCPVRNHLAIEFEGRTRSGLAEPVDYAFLEAREGGCQPVRFNPCEPIHYVVNDALAPPGAVDDLQEAMRRVEAATGLTFVNDGRTDEPGATSRNRFQPERYGNRWAPVLIVWDHGSRHRMDASNPGGGRSFPTGGVSVSGVLIINVDAVVTAGFGEGASRGRVFIHELGHLVGLGHVARSDQIMFAEIGVQKGPAEFHAGDLTGLRLIGKEAGCLPTPPAPR